MLKELNVEPTKVDISAPFNSWHANIFLHKRKKNIVFMNDLSRVSLSIFGIKKVQYKHLHDIFRQELRLYLLSEGIKAQWIDSYLEEAEKLVYSTTNNRSVIGTMVEITFIICGDYSDFSDTLEQNQWNNRFIYKANDYQHPIEVFKAEIARKYQ
nr:hypothetical protein [Paenibacillus monticola]